MTQNIGLVIDGPLFGTNLVAESPRWNVAIMPDMKLGPDDAVPVELSVKHVTYCFNPDRVLPRYGRNCATGVWCTEEAQFGDAWDSWVGQRDEGKVKAGSPTS